MLTLVEMDPVKNPFNPGAGTRPPALVGRDELLSAFDVTLQRALGGRPGKSMMPTGLRGVGKTVLLNEFVAIGERLGFCGALIEASETGNLAALLAIELRKALFQLDRGRIVSEVVRRGLRVLKSFAVTMTPDGMPAFEIGIDAERGQADSGNLVRDLTDLLVAVGEACRDQGRGLLVAIDEVQYLSAAELGSLISAVHRTTQLSLPVVLVGAGLPQVPALAGEAKSYSERLFNFPIVDSLGEPQAREAVEKPARDAGGEFQDDALAEIVRVTHGYPYFIQEWAYQIWNHAPNAPITYADVRGVEEIVLRQLDENFFRVRFDRLTPTERRYLRAMATLGPGAHRSGEIAERYGAKVASVAPMRSALIKKGMIYSPQHGDTAFTVPLFDEFMLRAMPDDLHA
jgi:hypothetical protein